MSESIISVDNLSKSYLIGHQGPREKYYSLRETISRGTRQMARKTIDTLRGKQLLQGDEIEEFWALKDISFDVKQGEVLGIIGRNGAGKSTLLKVLSRITEPTKGRVVLYGRVASLLEVGTGFHPELTGRENIFLNGAILGMAKSEIRRKFDEIVDFAGVERFLDTPVKRYSSGMYVRLAFAVAAHLEPEILVVDEVLAVGDSEFQKKCMGKMQDVANGGRTVLFVSHNMAAVESLCSRAVLMKQGQLVDQGHPSPLIEKYLAERKEDNTEALLSEARRSGTGKIRLRKIVFRNHHDEISNAFPAGGSASIEFTCENTTLSEISNVSIGYSVSSDRGNLLSVQYSDYEGKFWKLQPGITAVKAYVDRLPLSSGSYEIGCRIIASGMEEDWPQYCVSRLHIEGGAFGGNASTPHSGRGPLLLQNRWE